MFLKGILWSEFAFQIDYLVARCGGHIGGLGTGQWVISYSN